MPWTQAHLKWLLKSKMPLRTADGKDIQVWEFQHQPDAAVLSEWAKHFRNHYCLDQEIDALRNGTGLSRAEYLRQIKFPHHKNAPGPSIRAGDFAEILVADYLQYVLGYWVPRTRYGRKDIRNESSKGCDTLGFKFIKEGHESANDVLALYESKAQLSGDAAKPRLQDAIIGSAKDEIRKAESLNAIKQHFFDQRLLKDVARVERFQDVEDRPYREVYGAAALFSTPLFCSTTIGASTTDGHPHSATLELVVIRGHDLMELVHELYRRAADEA